jgi:hypothetical protein
MTYHKYGVMATRNIIETARGYGYTFNTGRPCIEDMEKFIYKKLGMNILPNIKPRKKRKRRMAYYKYVKQIATQYGYKPPVKQGPYRITDIEDFLTSKQVKFEKQVLVARERVKYSKYLVIPPARIDYFQLLYNAKLLGYEKKSIGRPSRLELEKYIGKVK